MALFLRILRQLPLAIVSPIALVACWVSLQLTDLCWKLFGRARQRADSQPDISAASVVIPNWNGRDLLERYLPSVIDAMGGNPRNEVIVVDNGSTDGSAAFVRERFPQVKLIALPENLGFGGGSNTGFEHAANDIVVLLNSDMRVAKDFLQPLLDGFNDAQVFAVSCQIFFSDPNKKREETGLTQGWWHNGALRLRHRIDDAIQEPFPCFYGGGGSCAFDRRKFLELGGFDDVLKPFYLEDTDLGYLAWKRGWKVLYQPMSHVWHEHRGTIGKKFSKSYIDSIVGKNYLLFCWKNIHKPSMLLSHLFHSWLSALISMLAGPSPERSSFAAICRASLQLPGAVRARWDARSLARIGDAEAFRRPRAGYFRDRFHRIDINERKLGVVFVSPYAVCPPVHGGGVFMNQTLRQLGQLTRLHLVALVDEPNEIAAHEQLRHCTDSMEFLVRMEGRPARPASLAPKAVLEFANQDLEWIIHRKLFTERLHVLQLEYTNMGQYACDFSQMACVLFEHDVFFQSIARGLNGRSGLSRLKASLEYLRALRFELRLLPKLDRIQTCTTENKRYLLSYLPGLADRIDDHVRAGIDADAYPFHDEERDARTMLFLGSFRHTPNVAALNWFLYEVMPLVLKDEPSARLTVIGSDPPPLHTVPTYNGAVTMAGFAPDIHVPLARHAVFICPILSGSGIRVKLLEAFASGIPAVSTTIGAEGLGDQDGLCCRLADDPAAFAKAITDLFANPSEARAMAGRARDYVLRQRNMPVLTAELEATYRRALTEKRQTS